MIIWYTAWAYEAAFKGNEGERVKFYSKVTFCDVMQNVHGSMLYIRVDYQQFKIKEGPGRGGGGGGVI